MRSGGRSAREARRRRQGRLYPLALVVAAALLSLAATSGSHSSSPGRARPVLHPRLDAKPDLSVRENRAIDRILAYTSYFRQGLPRKREVALTFDDGPGPYTAQILSVLRRYHAPATFFEVGSMVNYFHDSTVQQVLQGEVIGDHTESHPFMAQLSKADQRAEILEQAWRIEQYGAPFPRLFRPPYGSFNANTLALLRRFHMLMVLWTVDSGDYSEPGVEAIVDRVLAGARPGAIILLHDAGGTRSQQIAALPAIIEKLRARHLRLVTIPRLALDDPPPRNQPPPAPLAGGD